MTRFLACIVLAWLVGAQAALAQDASPPPDDAAKITLRLAKLFMDLPAGTQYVAVWVGNGGVFCRGDPDSQKTWTAGRVAEKISPFLPAFKTELTAAGFNVVTPGEDNLFETDEGSADYEVAGVITDEHVRACVSPGSFFTDVKKGDVMGTASLAMDWQVYSRSRRQVVARLSTSGKASLDKAETGGAQKMVITAFSENLRQLVQSADFKAAMAAPKVFTAGFRMPDQQSKIELAGSLKVGSRKIADATGSVMTILVGTGSGSGFLVSSDGYVLTDAHVVGDAKTVRVRWPDGLEAMASVERVSKIRDVAILKTNPRDRTPLALKRGPVTPGQRVYAIGSPMGKNFEGTVSSGVISADRTVDGLRYIQSDTTVSHGSSGGPLLDEHGAVIGLTDLGLPGEGPTGEMGPAGLNLFTPIGDAMDFLALEQK